MRISLDHLPAMRQGQLLDIAKVIARALRPEKIILFGTFAAGGFGTDDPVVGTPVFPVGYELLVVTRKGDRRYDYEVQDMIENRCRIHTPVTVLIHDISYVNEQLSAGHYFFSMLDREGILLYDAGNIPLSVGATPDLAHIKAVAERDFEQWWRRARAFFKSVQFNRQEKEWKIAVFLLHQAAESAYQAILLSFTGYKPCTHNLDKLRRYTNRFSIELATLFSRDSPEEDRLFKLLLQGYVDARYKEEYIITEEELGLLTERVSRLLSIAARICRNRFISLDRMRLAG
jgi:HEPN domain-containing protein